MARHARPRARSRPYTRFIPQEWHARSDCLQDVAAAALGEGMKEEPRQGAEERLRCYAAIPTLILTVRAPGSTASRTWRPRSSASA